jgi:hypothetical protein
MISAPQPRRQAWRGGKRRAVRKRAHHFLDGIERNAADQKELIAHVLPHLTRNTSPAICLVYPENERPKCPETVPIRAPVAGERPPS